MSSTSLLRLFSRKTKLSPFSFFFFWQELSGDDDIVDTSVEMTEVNEDVVERQEMVLETTDEVITKDTLVDGSDSGGTMANETLGVTVSDEAILVMAGKAIHETISIMAEEASDETHASTADVVDVDKAFKIVPVVADEAFTGMADKTRVDKTYEVILVVANSNIAIIAGSAAEDDHD